MNEKKLRRIIREEIRTVLNEQNTHYTFSEAMEEAASATLRLDGYRPVSFSGVGKKDIGGESE